jgi:CHAT domain-containing protein
MEVHEILADLDLSGVNLVVLSACQTASGKRSGGDEIVGLTRAFLYAGTPGVISTLWNIHDAATAILMEDFYRRLLEGVSVAEALRQAQLSLLRTPSYQDPYYWAAFSLTGDPQGRWKAPAPASAPAAEARRGGDGLRCGRSHDVPVP